MKKKLQKCTAKNLLLTTMILIMCCMSITLGIVILMLSVFLNLNYDKIKKFSETKIWLTATILVGLLTAFLDPENLWLTMLFSGIVGAGIFLKEMDYRVYLNMGYASLGMLIGCGILMPETASAESLGTTITNIQNLATKAQNAAPVLGGVAGLGFGASGLIEIVKSKNGQGGDFGSGMKKILIGGGLAGIGTFVKMSSGDMTGTSSSGTSGIK